MQTEEASTAGRLVASNSSNCIVLASQEAEQLERLLVAE